MASSAALILLISSVLLATAAYIRREPGHADGSFVDTHLHFYMHDAYGGPRPTAALIVTGREPLPLLSDDSAAGPEATSSSSPRRFGDIAVMNNALTEGPERGSARVGTAQGFTVRVAEHGAVNDLSLHLVFEAGEYGGSSLAVKGRVDTGAVVRESIIVGGTGRFRFATGYALSRSYDYDITSGGIVEIDVYVQLRRV
ncbi:dirigent protein 1-like [Hordeum vulgare]|uniref:Dirigent protein n=1 Tax=Hordeum vulgare subsp. vulgare TaxID=112509 RepID=F2D0K4_HORVV|nr:dirigent protein 1-like [Hordeum vulgare subsp. vulgare]KAE8802677.1 dirigent protein 1-like [Hordeum vulgare]BAJ88625.1 predicted protein [Hordeum vulgare subsp. vulgare]